jgi:hypothetical protein
MNAAEIEALVDARVAAALAPKALPPAMRPRFFATSTHYAVAWVVNPPADETGWTDPRQRFQSGYNPDAVHLGLSGAIEIARKYVAQHHLPVRVISWDGKTAATPKRDEIIISQQLFAKGSDSPLNEKRVTVWPYSKELPQSVTDDLDTLAKEFGQ